MHMAATLHRLQTKKTRLGQEQATEIRQMVLALDGLPDETMRAFLLTIDRQTAATRGWTFVMLSPAQNAAVVTWLRRNSGRPGVAVQLWAELLTGLRIDTGEVLITRKELAERVEAAPNAVTDILTELEGIGAISRQRKRVKGMRGPGQVSVFVNPNVATRLVGTARDKAQADHRPVETVDWSRQGRGSAGSLPVLA